MLRDGRNTTVFVGEDGSDPADLAAKIFELESLWTFDVEEQGWLVDRLTALCVYNGGRTTVTIGWDQTRRRTSAGAG